MPLTHPGGDADDEAVADAPTDISVVIPTLREAENIPVVVERASAALAGRSFEIIIVDDNSRDGTVEVVAKLAERLPVKLIVREVKKDGLSGAVLLGLGQARGKTLVVMDADLQHPPEVIPQLVDAITVGGAHFSLGSRYVPGGGVANTWSTFRRLNSYVATLLARPFARGVNDPMSGFFAISRDAFERGEFIAPTGYKIALELIAKCHVGEVKEVPIRFGLRERGKSKLTMKEQFRYLEHLSRLYDFTYPRGVPAAKFLITVLLAFLVANGVFAALREPAAVWAVTLAYACGVVMTAMFHTRYVRTQRAFLPRQSPWADFLVASAAELSFVALTATYLFLRAKIPVPIEVLAISFCVGTVVRYLVRKELRMDVRGLRFRE